MKKKRQRIMQILALVFRPIQQNAYFFVFMYLLGLVSAWTTLPSFKGAHLYTNLYQELFFDLYLLCFVLTLLPRRVRRWSRLLLCIVFYAVTIIDVYCFSKYGSTLTPTMLLLVGETDAREAGEFLTTCLSVETLTNGVGWVLLLATAHLLMACWLGPLLFSKLPRGVLQRLSSTSLQAFCGIAVAILMVWCGLVSWHNKEVTCTLLTRQTIGEVEHELTRSDRAALYLPVHRLVFSVYANTLTAQQLEVLIAAKDKAVVDSCSYRSPHIVLIIGESYGRHHAQQYGYFMPTTPRQLAREKTGRLIKFTDVVAPWNLTSFVFKNVFSMHVVGQQGEWCDYPLFPQLFRKAGYEVVFLTNQFLPKAREAVYDFSGGFFLNNPELSEAMFDVRNEKTHRYDEGLLKDYDQLLGNDSLRKGGGDITIHPRLTIFHLLGQHLSYKTRYPRSRCRFRANDYKERRPELSVRQRGVLADYDNACLYNDSIVDQICRRFEQEDAVVIYMPDHGEECYEGKRGIVCRNHSATIDYDLAHFEFEIPFWIWCSKPYVRNHPDLFRQMVAAKDRRLMTDALPHLLLYLAGIASPDYHEEYNVLSPNYHERRPRILKNTTDYDGLKPSVNAHL